MPDPRNQGTDVKMLYDSGDKGQRVDLRPYRSRIMAKWYGIPTSFFSKPGNDAFAWGTVGLVGCSIFVIVKTPTPEDERAGVYMAHI